MNAPRAAVIRFPGVNCEEETRRAVEASGGACDIVMWNDAREVLEGYDGYVLPGGFSYQDRVRAGAIAAKDAVVQLLVAAAEAGKPVLGIYNGAQVLLESGLVPGCEPGRVEMALATNVMPDRDGYHARWCHLRVAAAGSCATLGVGEGDVLPIPVAHAEGRFVSRTDGLFETLAREGQIVMTYATSDGGNPDGFPSNPNGSRENVAAVSNPPGNVVAMMPHPERAARLGQVPTVLEGPWGARRRDAGAEAFDDPGPGSAVFDGFVASCRKGAVR
ncbi:MAG: phosphoribosylformylglycinamidine synthase I [Candidatus Eisenbacteria bacterium]|nr:phosphoribosylformylglycinamidine synthase I [Candidatus Eisenbacteria bacterium]